MNEQVRRRVILSPYRRDELRWDISRFVLCQLGDVAPVHIGDSPGPVFSRAHALNEASRKAGDWDVAYVSDCDKLPCDLAQIREAMDVAEATGQYVVARSSIRYLTPRGTNELLVEGAPPCGAHYREEVLRSWDDTFALRRDRWEEVGGFDERIAGYGGQGVALAAAAGTLFGREMIPGVVVHLHHPQMPGRLAAIARNAPLVQRYRDADGDPNAIRSLLAEARL